MKVEARHPACVTASGLQNETDPANMKLASKVVIVLATIIVLYTIANYLVVNRIMMPSFVALERVEAEKDLQRLIDAVQNEVGHLNSFTQDWARWDDTYAFVAAPSGDYPNINLVRETFTQNSLNLIFFYDAASAFVWGKIVDLDTEQQILLPQFPIGAPPQMRRLIEHVMPDDNIAGLVTTARGLMFLASRPILTSEGDGPIRGTLIMGRFLNEGVVKSLSEQVHIKSSITDIDDATTRELMLNAINRLPTDGSARALSI